MVRDDAKMDRRTVGVTGIRRLDVSLPTEDEGETCAFGGAPLDRAGCLLVVDILRLSYGDRQAAWRTLTSTTKIVSLRN
jgi:hypothetical protein